MANHPVIYMCLTLTTLCMHELVQRSKKVSSLSLIFVVFATECGHSWYCGDSLHWHQGRERRGRSTLFSRLLRVWWIAHLGHQWQIDEPLWKSTCQVTSNHCFECTFTLFTFVVSPDSSATPFVRLMKLMFKYCTPFKMIGGLFSFLCLFFSSFLSFFFPLLRLSSRKVSIQREDQWSCLTECTSWTSDTLMHVLSLILFLTFIGRMKHLFVHLTLQVKRGCLLRHWCVMSNWLLRE